MTNRIRVATQVVGATSLCAALGFARLPETQQGGEGKGGAAPAGWAVYRPLLAKPAQQSLLVMQFALCCSYASPLFSTSSTLFRKSYLKLFSVSIFLEVGLYFSLSLSLSLDRKRK